jgi:hypothetical protein
MSDVETMRAEAAAREIDRNKSGADISRRFAPADARIKPGRICQPI